MDSVQNGVTGFGAKGPRPQCVVVTGVHGFIGSRVLLDGHHRLGPSVTWIGVDARGTEGRATAGRTRGLPGYSCADYGAFLMALEDGAMTPDVIIHNGACSSTTETNPEVFRELNLGYSETLWTICSRRRIPLIYASSASVYGDGRQGFDDDPLKTAGYKALNLYGASKLDFDNYALRAAECPPFWFGLRYFNVYGFDESHKGGQASMVYHGTRQAETSGKIRLFRGNKAEGGAYGDGEQMRDFVAVEDVVHVTWDLVGRIFASGGVDLKNRLAQTVVPELPNLGHGTFMNVGTGRARTWNDLARAVFAALGMEPCIEYIEMPLSLRAHYQSFTEAQHTVGTRLGLTYPWLSLEQGAATYLKALKQAELDSKNSVP